MRIVAGKFRGRPILAPDAEGTRPTSDRVREAVFNILAHGIEGLSLEGARVLDLFAGTGALGLEAMSRGAQSCLFVEDAPEARGIIRQNIEAFGLTGSTRIYRRDATDLGKAGGRDRYSLAFLDPPYGKGLGEKALAAAADGGWLDAGAVVVFEERVGVAIAWPRGFEVLDERSWGDTAVAIARYVPASRSVENTR